MRTRRRPRLLLEALERREVPASIVYNGSLSISAPRGAIVVTQNASTGYWAVTDAGSNQGTFNVTGGITITAGNAPANITVQFAPNKSLPSNLTITGGNGADTISVQGATGASIGGNLSIDGGYGNDSIGVGNLASLTVRGNTELTGDLGTNTLLLGNDAASSSQFRGTLKIHSMENITVGGTTSVLGATTIDMLQAPNSTATVFGPLSATFDTAAALQGLTVNGIATPTTLIFSNSSGSIGTTTLNLGTSTNVLKLNTQVNGNFTLNDASGAGGTAVTLGPSLNVTGTVPGFGNLTLNMGSGANAFDLNHAFNVAGNFTLNAVKDIGPQAIIFGGTVNGKASFTFGNGDDSIGIGAASTLGALSFTATDGDDDLILNGSVAGLVAVNLGNGTDAVTVNNHTVTLQATLGSGDDTVSLNLPGTGSSSINVSYGTGSGGFATFRVREPIGGTGTISGTVTNNTTNPGTRIRVNVSNADVASLTFVGSWNPW